jgi:hypothetical protein
MKTLLVILFVASLGSVLAWASDDPVKDFLEAPAAYVRDPGYYATDKVFRVDLDLQGNGQIETLVTLNRDRDGQQGNIWKVYKKTAAGYQSIGTMTFSPEHFYLGKIDELGEYGLLTFGPAGAHSGSVRAYIDDGSGIREISLTGVESIKDLSKDGRPFKKYLQDKVTNGAEVIMVKGAKRTCAKVRNQDRKGELP